MPNSQSDTSWWPMGPDGRRHAVPYLTQGSQVARWSALGFDADAAVGRQLVLAAARQAETDILASNRILVRFYREEAVLVEGQGVPKDDPDFFLIAAAPKAYW